MLVMKGFSHHTVVCQKMFSKALRGTCNIVRHCKVSWKRSPLSQNEVEDEVPQKPLEVRAK